MHGINLARRPFVNRRPILRLAILLWIVGALLAVHNFRQYSGHWKGTSVNRQRLAEIEAEIREERAKLRQLDPLLAGVGITRQNRQAAFLNQLIAARTFPWSALFDDLENVLPLDVRLLNVSPNVKLAAEPAAPRRSRRATGRGSRSARRTAAGEGAAAGADGEGTTAGETSENPEEIPLRRNEVRLRLGVVGRNEDSLLEFIDALYADPSFRAPFVPGEKLNADGSVRFSVTVIYLTRRPGEEPSGPAAAAVEEPPAVAATPAAAAQGALAAAAGEGQAGEDPVVTESGSETGGQAAPGRTARQSAESRATETAVEGGEAGASPGRSGRGRRGSEEPEAGTAAERGSRPRERVLTGSTAGVAAPGAAASGAGEAPAPGASESPTPSSPEAESPRNPSNPSTPGNQNPEQPEFEQPAASATPRLRRGTLIPPIGWLAPDSEESPRFPQEALA